MEHTPTKPVTAEMPSPSSRIESPRRTLAVGAGALAVSAWTGAAGLIGGGLSMGSTINRRLPYDSPVVAGVALALAVGLPATVLALRAWRGDERTDATAEFVGVGLLCWIACQIVVIRTFSWLQPVISMIGVWLIWAARRHQAQGDARRLQRPS
jgi:hypothetical protein